MTMKLAFPLSVVAAAALAACVSIPATRIAGTADNTYVASAAATPSSAPVRTGIGRVGHPMSSDTVVNGVAHQTVTITMKDGFKQTLFVNGAQLRMHELVEVRSDNTIRHVVEQ
jgi:hypothetical protein